MSLVWKKQLKQKAYEAISEEQFCGIDELEIEANEAMTRLLNGYMTEEEIEIWAKRW